MALRRRITPASVVVVMLSVSVGVAPQAAAEPCTAAAAQAVAPAAQNVQTAPWQPIQGSPRNTGPAPSSPPTGHKPQGASESAPLPNLGQLSRTMLSAIDPRTGQVQQQAAVAPVPKPSPAPSVTAPQVIEPAPVAGPAPAAAPPGTSLVGWVTGPDSPNDTIGRFAITGTDLGIMWDNGTGGQVLMAFGTLTVLASDLSAVRNSVL